jgi:hypothetical protein
MARVGESEHEYLGYSIEVAGFTESRGLVARVHIWPPGTSTEDDDTQVSFFEKLSPIVKRRSRDWPDEDAEAVQQVVERALHRARGAILLDRVEELAGATFTIPGAEEFAERSNEYVRRLVLTALERALRAEPGSYGHVPFDDIGLCLMEDIDPRQMQYVLQRLERARLIEAWAAGGPAGNRRICATDAGLEAADKLIVERNAPGLLLEETIARVENILNRHKPELTVSLRRQAIRVAEAREMDEHEVGEVAHACEQIIWDALDLDAFWEGIAGARPAREKTRDRLRLILKARVPSETEQELLEGLEQYVVGWFGPLEQFIHKHRKLPKESDRAHGRRIVVYTYMLLGDLMELFGL